MSNEMQIWIVVGVIAVVAILSILIIRSAQGTRKLKAIGLILILLWFARLIVDWKNPGLGKIEAVMTSFVHSLQTFSMDAEYAEYTIRGKNYLNDSGYHFLSVSYGLGVSVLNVLAPIFGGALLLEILSASFPIIRVYMHPFCHKFVFSEMNENAVTLAEDMIKDKKYRKILPSKYIFSKPLLIFTDAYRDNESESNSELFCRARAIGAVCIKNDLLHLSFVKSKSVDYFLMDMETNKNLSILTSLLKNKRNKKKLWPERSLIGKEEPRVRIYTFLQTEAECATAATVYRKSEKRDYVVVRSIRDYRNATINLLHDVPLFLPLMPKNGRSQTLTVSILGSGHIGEEVFKNVLWCGQMLDVRLHINVVSADADSFKSRINDTCPELLESCSAGSEILHFSENDINIPYSENQFEKVEDVRSFSKLPGKLLKETDYYVIALGSDDLNLEVMNLLKERIMKNGLQTKSKKNPVIALALYNGELAEAVKVIHPKEDQEAPDQAPYIIPFATRESRFSCKNVFLLNFTDSALATGKMYTKKNADKELTDEYSYWANLVRTVHVPYKLYGIGAIEGIEYKEEKEKTENKEKADIIKYKEEDRRKDSEFLKLSWIEHRRWNAFLRTQGFSKPTPEQYEGYYENHVKGVADTTDREVQKIKISMHKSVELKLHPCIVERSIEGDIYKEDDKDFLDQVTCDNYKKEKIQKDKLYYTKEEIGEVKDYDYKRWDLYKEDFPLQKIICEQALKYYENKLSEVPEKGEYQGKKTEVLKEMADMYLNAKLYNEAGEIYLQLKPETKKEADEMYGEYIKELKKEEMYEELLSFYLDLEQRDQKSKEISYRKEIYETQEVMKEKKLRKYKFWEHIKTTKK